MRFSSILHPLGRFSSWMSSAQSGTTFWLTRSDLFAQFIEVCFNFPDLLDIEARSLATIPIYFLAGLVDFAIISIVLGVYAQLSSLWRTSSSATDQLVQLANAGFYPTQIALLLGFVVRARRFGLRNMLKVCKLRTFGWAEMRMLNTLLLMFCPALFWHCLTQFILTVFEMDATRPWLTATFHLILSADWDTAKLYSGWYYTDLKNGTSIDEYNANSTWVDVVKVSLRKTAIAVPLEMLLKNTPTILLAIFTVMQVLARPIGRSLARVFGELRKLTLIEKYSTFETFITMKRDRMVNSGIRFMRKGRSQGSLLNTLLSSSTRSEFLRQVTVAQLRCNRLLQQAKSSPRASFLRRYFTEIQAVTATGPGARQFRLLEVHPAWDPADPVICTLSSHMLETAPKYTAISYVWGSDDRNATICLNSKVYKTTTSAEQALKALRSGWKRNWFWIDAICIDQDSVEDTADQLSIMSDIYWKANKVIVWLGPNPDAALAINLARRLFLQTRLSSSLFDSTPYYSSSPQHAWQSLQRLLQNNWFERSWVVQEVLSGRNIKIRFGDATIDWKSFSFFALAIAKKPQITEILYASNDDGHLSSLKNVPVLKINHIRAMEELRAIKSRGREQYKHLSLLYYLTRMFRSSCTFKATHRKDRIYALVNLCGLANNAKFKPDFVPSIHKSFTYFDLYTVVAQHLLTSGPGKRRLDVLAHAGITNRSGSGSSGSMPSWVPDWSVETASSKPFLGQEGTSELLHHPALEGILENIADLQAFDEISFKDTPPARRAALENLKSMAATVRDKSFYRATKETLPHIKVHSQPGNYLELQGFHLDTITLMGSEYPLAPRTESSNSLSKHELRDVAFLLGQWFARFVRSKGDLARSRHKNALLREFCRVIFADLSHPTCDFARSSLPLRPPPADSITYWFNHVCFLWSSLDAKIDMDARLREKSPEALNVFWETQSHLAAVCGGRAFGATSQGIAGILPASSKIGDEICLFLGADVPFVVRPAGEVTRPCQVDDESDLRGISSQDHLTEDPMPQPPQEPAPIEPKPVHELVGSAFVFGFMDAEGIPTTWSDGSRTYILK